MRPQGCEIMQRAQSENKRRQKTIQCTLHLAFRLMGVCVLLLILISAVITLMPLIQGDISFTKSPVYLVAVLIHGIPNFDGHGYCRPYLRVYQDLKVVYTSDILSVGPGTEADTKKRIVFEFPTPLVLNGDIMIRLVIAVHVLAGMLGIPSPCDVCYQFVILSSVMCSVHYVWQSRPVCSSSFFFLSVLRASLVEIMLLDKPKQCCYSI